MASFMAEKAANNLFKDVERDLTQSTQNTFGGGPTAEADGQNEIDWVNFNYPPFLRLFHFDLAELPSKTRAIVRWIHISFLVALVVMLVNFLNNIILAALGLRNGWWNVAYSVLNFVIGAPVGCFVFYTGYKGLAKHDSKLKFRYMIMGGVLILIYVVFAIIPWGPFNGFIALALMGDDQLYYFSSGSDRGYAIFVIVLESTLWLVSATIAAVSVWRVHSFNAYEDQDSRNINVE